MPNRQVISSETVFYDVRAGLVVFLVALPLCLGVAVASGAPPISGLLSGIVGGILVGAVSRSQTSVSGSSPGLAAVVMAQIAAFSPDPRAGFSMFLAAVVIAGFVQVALGLAKGGFIADFFPTSVIKGLLAAIGVLLVLKQFPHLVGHDPEPDGSMAFAGPGKSNTFTVIWDVVTDFRARVHEGAAAVGMVSLTLMLVWEKTPWLKKSLVPAPLVVVVVGVALAEWFRGWGDDWWIQASQNDRPGHLVEVPMASSLGNFVELLTFPDPGAWLSAATWRAGVTLAIVASLETLLNLEAVDKIDPLSRTSSPNRELVAQGIGNIAAGLVGAIPISSVIVRSSVNIQAGARTQLSTIVHGAFLLGSALLLPTWLNRIPLSCLAAILIVTGFKLASPRMVRAAWSKGWNQFLPFAVTLAAIVLTDLLVGVVIGLAFAVAFILWSNVRRPLHRIVEKHVGGEVMHLRLANQVSFLNRAAIHRALDEVRPGGHLLIDARETDYIDPDVLDLIRDFEAVVAPSRRIQVSLQGFHERYQMVDRIQYVDYSTRELQRQLTPRQVLQILVEGHQRFISGQPLRRDSLRQIDKTANGQFPLAVVLSCIDSRTSAELIFDLGFGDIFSVRIAGNIAEDKVLGSMEYACAVAGAKLIVVMGHTKCGAVTAAVDQFLTRDPRMVTGFPNLDGLVAEIQKSVDPDAHPMTPEDKTTLVEDACSRNILRTVEAIREMSPCLADLERDGRIAVVAVKYDVSTGRIKFLSEDEITNPTPSDLPECVLNG